MDATNPLVAALASLPIASPFTPEQEARIDRMGRENDWADDYAARRAPELAREYAQNRAKVALALVEAAEASGDLVGKGREEPVTAALMAGDFADVGRLLAVRVDAVLREWAEDAAELEALERIDAGALT
jgi:hypothetical protein